MNPEVLALEPAEGIVGTAVRITGEHFSPLAAVNEVRFRGAAARAEEASDDGASLLVHVPAGARTGPVSVWIVRDGVVLRGEGPVFTVLPSPPAITTIDPPFATWGIESIHRIEGSGFTPEIRMWIGDHPVRPAYLSPTTLEFALDREEVPPGDHLLALNTSAGTGTPVPFPLLLPWLLQRVEAMAPDAVLLDFNRVPDLATFGPETIHFAPALEILDVSPGASSEQVVLHTAPQPLGTIYSVLLDRAVRAADPQIGWLYRDSAVFGSFGELPANTGSCRGRWDCSPGWVCTVPTVCDGGVCQPSGPACGFTSGTCVDARGWLPDEDGRVCGCNGLWYETSADTAWGTTAHELDPDAAAARCDSSRPCAADDDCFPDGYCERVDCGGPGVCSPRPLFCTDGDPWPVCGCDGVVYESVCKAAQAGVSVRHAGADVCAAR